MKNIVLGITGSIAAYKAADIANTLTKEGHGVHVIMTKAGVHHSAHHADAHEKESLYVHVRVVYPVRGRAYLSGTARGSVSHRSCDGEFYRQSRRGNCGRYAHHRFSRRTEYSGSDRARHEHGNV